MPNRACLVFTLLLATGATAVSPVLASTQPQAVIALHAAPATTKVQNVCGGLSVSEDPNTLGIPCNEFNVDQVATQTAIHVYLVAAQGNAVAGFGGLSCGIQTSGSIGVFDWYLCADQDQPSAGWPDPGGGNIVSWNTASNCQQTEIGGAVQAVAGAFYVYAYGNASISVVANPTPDPDVLQVMDCDGGASPVPVDTGAGSVGFGVNTGDNPCATIADCGCPGQPFGNVSCCCYPDGTAQACVPQGDCEAAGGSYHTFSCDIALGHDCVSLTGCQPVAAEKRTWGSIKSKHP